MTSTRNTVTWLAIDDVSLPWKKNAGLYLSKPRVRPEPVLRPAPPFSGAVDDAGAHFYGTVLHDESGNLGPFGGHFRMWYYACHWGKNPDWPPRMMQQVARTPGWFRGDCPLFQGPLCYAESADGIHWTKPELGQVLFKGSRANNALALPHTIVSGAVLIKDDDDPDPARRYKMTYQFFPDQSDPVIEEYGTLPSVALAVSPDGLRWNVTGIPFRNQFVEPSSFVKHAGNYIIHYQVMQDWAGWFAEGGTPCGRTGVARISPDFDHWPDVMAEAFAPAEPEDRSRRGASGAYDQVHLGVGAASLGNVCVGLYGLWHNAENSHAFDHISCDFGLLVSNDGVRFREPAKGYRFMRREESPATPVPGRDFNTNLCQANGIINAGDETRIYHGRWRNAGNNQMDEDLQYYSGEVALATLPRDRWGALALNPNADEGAVTSAPYTLPARGCDVTVNADEPGCLSVEVLNEYFQPISNFSGAESAQVPGDSGLSCPVRWPNHSLSELAGQTVRLRVNLRRAPAASPRLYALYLTPSN